MYLLESNQTKELQLRTPLSFPNAHFDNFAFGMVISLMPGKRHFKQTLLFTQEKRFRLERETMTERAFFWKCPNVRRDIQNISS